jgi:hypothetical protein
MLQANIQEANSPSSAAQSHHRRASELGSKWHEKSFTIVSNGRIGRGSDCQKNGDSPDH